MNNVLRVSINKLPEPITKAPTPKIIELEEPIPSSDTQTSDIAKVAAEVADSACAIDSQAPEQEISDVEAGRMGIRRMSNTPISEVAQTAMEVSVVAATLDGDDSDSSTELDDESDSCPMLSHESIGPPNQGEETSDDLASKTVTQDGDSNLEIEDLDFDNPRLEKLPSSDRRSIIAAMRRISGSVEADRTVIDGIPPPSDVPILRLHGAVSPREELRGSSELTGTSSKEESTDRPSLTTGPSNSSYSRTSDASISSLGSIAEGDELPNDNVSEELIDPQVTSPYAQHPGPSWGSVFDHAVGSDSDDEGIAMRSESRRRLEELENRSPSSTSNPVTSLRNEITEPSPWETTVINEEVDATADSKDAPIIEAPAFKDSPIDTTYRLLPGTYESDSSNRENTGEGKGMSTSTDPNNEADLQKDTADRKDAPSPTHPIRGPKKSPSWLETCFHVVLVKWLGGLAAWIYGGRRPT